MTDTYVRLIPLPVKVEGVTLPNDDGSFDIYINSRLSPAMQQATLEHELRHIRRGSGVPRSLRRIVCVFRPLGRVFGARLFGKEVQLLLVFFF